MKKSGVLFPPCELITEPHRDIVIVVGKILGHQVPRRRTDGPDGTRVAYNLHLNHGPSTFEALQK